MSRKSRTPYGRCVRPTEVAYVLRKSRTSYGSRVRPTEVAYVRKSRTYGSCVRTEVAYALRKSRTPTEVAAYGSHATLYGSHIWELTFNYGS